MEDFGDIIQSLITATQGLTFDVVDTKDIFEMNDGCKLGDQMVDIIVNRIDELQGVLALMGFEKSRYLPKFSNDFSLLQDIPKMGCLMNSGNLLSRMVIPDIGYSECEDAMLDSIGLIGQEIEGINYNIMGVVMNVKQDHALVMKITVEKMRTFLWTQKAIVEIPNDVPVMYMTYENDIFYGMEDKTWNSNFFQYKKYEIREMSDSSKSIVGNKDIYLIIDGEIRKIPEVRIITLKSNKDRVVDLDGNSYNVLSSKEGLNDYYVIETNILVAGPSKRSKPNTKQEVDFISKKMIIKKQLYSVIIVPCFARELWDPLVKSVKYILAEDPYAKSETDDDVTRLPLDEEIKYQDVGITKTKCAFFHKYGMKDTRRAEYLKSMENVTFRLSNLAQYKLKGNYYFSKRVYYDIPRLQYVLDAENLNRIKLLNPLYDAEGKRIEVLDLSNVSKYNTKESKFKKIVFSPKSFCEPFDLFLLRITCHRYGGFMYRCRYTNVYMMFTRRSEDFLAFMEKKQKFTVIEKNINEHLCKKDELLYFSGKAIIYSEKEEKENPSMMCREDDKRDVMLYDDELDEYCEIIRYDENQNEKKF